MEFSEFAARAAEIESAAADLEIVSLVGALFRDADDDRADRSPAGSRMESGDLAILARFVHGRVFPTYDSTTLDVGPSLLLSCARARGRPKRHDRRRGGSAGGDRRDRRGRSELRSGRPAGPLGLRRRHDGAHGERGRFGASDARGRVGSRQRGQETRYPVRAVYPLSPRRSEISLAARPLGDAHRRRRGSSQKRDLRGVLGPERACRTGLTALERLRARREIARDEGEAGLGEVSLEIGRPVQAMLAQADTVGEAITDWDEVAVEWKYDGARVQIHADDEIRVFSRNMEEVTAALPEIVEFCEIHLDAPAILDGEVVAVDDAGAPLPFQDVLRRFRRKHDIERAREEVLAVRSEKPIEETASLTDVKGLADAQ